jgi:hypothetical protein
MFLLLVQMTKLTFSITWSNVTFIQIGQKVNASRRLKVHGFNQMGNFILFKPQL